MQNHVEQYKPRTDPYGFEEKNHPFFDAEIDYNSKYSQDLFRRKKRWEAQLAHMPFGRNSKYNRFCRKGIPQNLRKSIWLSLIDQPPHNGFNQLKNLETPSVIKADLNRTFPENRFFSKTINRNPEFLGPLEDILTAAHHSNPEVGYCQGQNFVGALLLLVTKDAESAFKILHHLCKNFKGYYAPDMKQVKMDVMVLTEFVRNHLPILDRQLVHYEVDLSLVVCKWVLCFFADTLPIETVFRIWDCLFYEGDKVIFRVILYLFKLNLVSIQAAKDGMQLVEALKASVRHPEVVKCHEFMANCYKFTSFVKRADIKRLRAAASVQLDNAGR